MATDPRSKHFWESKDMPAQDGKVFIVTGSSSGMGFYCAEALAQRGAHVIIAARSLERCEKAAQMIKVHCPQAYSTWCGTH
jgi:NAD(P)-dependent dehydrogenase (short-subunit alcohol dehydrogenase family)